jgi:hypothetical protein
MSRIKNVSSSIAASAIRDISGLQDLSGLPTTFAPSCDASSDAPSALLWMSVLTPHRANAAHPYAPVSVDDRQPLAEADGSMLGRMDLVIDRVAGHNSGDGRMCTIVVGLMSACSTPMIFSGDPSTKKVSPSNGREVRHLSRSCRRTSVPTVRRGCRDLLQRLTSRPSLFIASTMCDSPMHFPSGNRSIRGPIPRLK